MTDGLFVLVSTKAVAGLFGRVTSSVGRIMRGKNSWPYYYAGVRSAGGPAKGTVGLTCEWCSTAPLAEWLGMTR